MLSRETLLRLYEILHLAIEECDGNKETGEVADIIQHIGEMDEVPVHVRVQLKEFARDYYAALRADSAAIEKLLDATEPAGGVTNG